MRVCVSECGCGIKMAQQPREVAKLLDFVLFFSHISFFLFWYLFLILDCKSYVELGTRAWRVFSSFLKQMDWIYFFKIRSE